MTNIEALKDVYVELGGKASDFDAKTNDEAIKLIAEVASGSLELPAVTSEDNGDVLTVVDGAWDKATPSGGSGLPEVTGDDNGDVLTVVEGAWAKGTVPYVDDWVTCECTGNSTYAVVENLTAKYSASRKKVLFGGYVQLNNFSFIGAGTPVVLIQVKPPNGVSISDFSPCGIAIGADSEFNVTAYVRQNSNQFVIDATANEVIAGKTCKVYLGAIEYF